MSSGVANVHSEWVGGDLYFQDNSGNNILGIKASGAVTFPNRVGVIPIHIVGARTLATNDTDTITNIGGILAKNSDPILERSNAATDKSLRISWASASVAEIQFPTIVWPSDVDAAAAVNLKMFAGMKAASVNTPVLTAGAFEGVGGSNLGGNSAALSTTAAVVSVALTVTGYPGFLSLNVKPGAHATSSNDVYLYAAWLEYTRK